jgi:hypothetical protein
MSERTRIDPADLPELKALHKASVGILLLSVLITVVAVLPAELGVDPTGMGTRLGLTALGELKHGDEAKPAEEAAAAKFRTDEISVVLAPRKGTEVKATMREGDQMIWSWDGGGGRVSYDFHGEPKGQPSSVFTSFEKGTARSAEGEFEAPFEGVHGWYWKNLAPHPITITLKTSGVYSKIGQVH